MLSASSLPALLPGESPALPDMVRAAGGARKVRYSAALARPAVEPRDAAWWLLLLLVAALTLVLVVSLGKDRAPGPHLGYGPGSLEAGRTPFPR